MEHPAWKIGVESNISTHNHSEYRDTAQNINSCNSFVHSYLDIIFLYTLPKRSVARTSRTLASEDTDALNMFSVGAA